MKFEKKNLWGIILGMILIVGGIVIFGFDPRFYFVVVIALVAGALPFVLSVVFSQGKQKEKEARFLEFTRDLVENVKSGTPISKSIVNLQNRDYGPLSENVRKLANQLALGITLNKALATFASDTKSSVIKRAVGLISEAQRAGGKIDSIIESVSESVNQTEALKKERSSAVSNLVVQGYIIFIVFIVIMLVLQFKILPMTAGLGNVGGNFLGGDSGGVSIDPESFSTPLLVMILVQSFFAGLVIGKIAEGSIRDGIKHSFILLALALLITTWARAFIGTGAAAA